MAKETAIKISSEFKIFLVAEKKEGETFEDVIKRKMNCEIPEIPSSSPVNPMQLTSQETIVDNLGRVWKFPKSI